MEKKNHYSDAELVEFKELIEKKLENAKQEVIFLHDQLLEINEESDAVKAGNFDEGSQNYEREHLAKMIQRAQEYVRNLEFALVRIQNKTYGICAITGELIDRKRLMLVPHTTKSMDGKTIEKQTPVPKPVIDKSAYLGTSEKPSKIITTTKTKSSSASSKSSKTLLEDDEIFNEFDFDVTDVEDIVDINNDSDID